MRSSCLWFQMFGVETSSFLPDHQKDRRNLARRGETSHRRFHRFGEQSEVEILIGSCAHAGQSGRPLEDTFQIMGMVGVEATGGQEFFFGTLELTMQEAELGTGSSRQG
jgi:hypothetical protein